MIALSGVALGRIYVDALLPLLVAGAAVLSVGTGAAARRLPSWSAAPISVVLLAGYAVGAMVLAADRAGLTDPLPSILRAALANGIPRMLTALIPVEPAPDTVIVPVVAAWLAGLAGAEIAVRAGRVLLGCVPAVALYAGALYVVGPNAAAQAGTSLAFAGLAGLALAVAAPRDPAPTGDPGPTGGPVGARGAGAAALAVRARALAGSAAALAAIAAVVALVAPWLGGQVSASPADPRRYVEPPQVDSLDESPLNRISGWALTPRQPLLQVSPLAPDAGQRVRLRLAVLPDYDGVTWRVGATYRNAGRVLPRPPQPSGVRVRAATQTITVDGLTGRLLPAAATPVEVSGARIAYDAATGTLMRPESLRAGLRYRVTSQRPAPDLNLLPTADAPAGAAVARYLAVGAQPPPRMRRLAAQLADGNAGAYDRAAAIEQFLAEHYRAVPDAPSGHAYPNLEYFLFGPRDQGGQRGTSEQFAASFAVLARLTGLPSRVVVGFDAPAGGGTVTGGDAIAWPEVLFDDLGWIAFDPMPTSDDPRPVEEDFRPQPSTPPPSSSPPPPPSRSASVPATPTAASGGPGPGPSTAVVATGASGTVVAMLGAAAAAVVLARRAQRRRRLFEGSPDERIAGAWHEFTDAMRLAGRPVPAHLAATEAAGFARLRAAAPAAADVPQREGPQPEGPPLDGLVAGVNATAFAPGAADPAAADRAGAQAVAFADSLRARRSWWRRAWWSVHPGPLRWHRRRTRTRS
ncbi:DUF3488 and transglutaminase-like domain-containing protein [Mangrovihabitans endophyticus]